MVKNIITSLALLIFAAGCATPYREFEAVKAHSQATAAESARSPVVSPGPDAAISASIAVPAEAIQPTDILPSAVEGKARKITAESLPVLKRDQDRRTAETADHETTTPVLAVQPQPVATFSAAQLTTITGGETLVNQKETLFGVSRRTGVSVADLASYNSLELPYTLHPGQKLHWPTLRYHRVVVGETAVAIAHHYGMALAELTEANGLSPPIVVRVGQVLRLPDKQVTQVRHIVPAMHPTVQPTEPKPVLLTPKADAEPDSHVKTTTQKTSAATAETTAPVILPSGPAPRFIWPLPGRIISGYGSKGSGRFNDGINIAAVRGEPVKAAADGTVVYANQLRGFGWLVLIKHRDNWVTTYAHNSTVLVAKGTAVHRGETIARAGATGFVTSPQLHFEIRRGTRAVDPTLQLPERDISVRESSDQAG